MDPTRTNALPPDQLEALLADGVETPKSAAAFLRVSLAKIYQMMASCELEYTRLGRCRRIPRRALIDLLARGLVTRNEQRQRS
jgi:excisionase family DNA binding protein